MKCSKCGHENADDAKFCQKCGNSIGANPGSDNESFFKKNKVLVIAIAAILCVAIVAGLFVYMNTSHGPVLKDYGISEFTEGDDYFVSLVDENGTPMEGKIIIFICYNGYGGSTVISNTTDWDGKCSFRLDFNEGKYKVDVNYIEENQSADPVYYNVTGFSKELTIKDGPHPQYNQEFVERYEDYVVRDKNIWVQPDSYEYETLFGIDEEGNNYSWWGGESFHNEDINNGIINTLE